MKETAEYELPEAAFEALVRLDAYERNRLEAITARSAQLTGSAAIVAALAGFLGGSPALVVAVALFVVAAAFGVAAQWPAIGEGLAPDVILSEATGKHHGKTHQRIAEGLVQDIHTSQRVADTRALLNRIGLIIQVVALVLVLVGAITRQGVHYG